MAARSGSRDERCPVGHIGLGSYAVKMWVARLLRKLLPRRLPEPRPKYIGLVHGVTKSTDTETTHDEYWILNESAGVRQANYEGSFSDEYVYWTRSPFARRRAAEVKAWLAGGPVPPLGYYTENSPPPKPRKTAPQKKRVGNVVEFKARTRR